MDGATIDGLGANKMPWHKTASESLKFTLLCTLYPRPPFLIVILSTLA